MAAAATSGTPTLHVLRASDKQELVLSGTAILMAAVVLPVAVFSITFPVAHFVNEQSTGRLLTFLSNTIDYPPASCIGTFGLVLSLGALLLFIVLRHVLLIERLSRASIVGGAPTALPSDGVFVSATDRIAAARERQLAAWRRSSERCLRVGCVSVLGGLVVCSFQPHYNLNIHISGAAVFFLGGAVFTTWQTVLDSQLAARLPHCDPSHDAALSAYVERDACGLKCRKAIAALTGMTFLAGFCVSMVAQGQQLFGWVWIAHVLPASDRDKLVAVYAPVVELFLFLCFVAHFATLIPTIWQQRVRLVLSVTWEGSDMRQPATATGSFSDPINRASPTDGGLNASLTDQVFNVS